MTTVPSSQYADDRNLRARQRLWKTKEPHFDLVAWVLDLAGVVPGQSVLDVGCGNGVYLRELAARGVVATGCDLSFGMLRGVDATAARCNADAVSLPFADRAFDVVLAPHMLYHVPDRPAAARELRRVLRPNGVCIAVTNGASHATAIRRLVERAAAPGTPGWEMRNPSTHEFSLENGAADLQSAFAIVECVRPADGGQVRIEDAGLVADYVASVEDHYAHEIVRPWSEIVAEVRTTVQRTIDAEGAFVLKGDPGAFVCR